MKKVLLFFISFFIVSSVYALEMDAYSKNIVLYNLNDDFIIAEENKDKKTSIASMTKIMTVLVAIEKIDNLDEKVILTNEVFKGLSEANASVAGFKVGQKVTYLDLLYGAFLPSGADATNALAINLAGSTDEFVELMNDKAKSMGLSNTHFNNTTGLDDDNHYSTVNDVAIMLKNALKNETFKEIFLAQKYTISDKTLTFYSTLSKSLKNYNINADYIVGGKTGYTLDAGRCLASVAYDEVNDIYYMLVTSNAPITTSFYHLLDAKNIYEYYFDNYKYFDLIKENQNITSVKTKYAKEKKYDINSSMTIKKYLKNDFDLNKLDIKYDGIEILKYNTKIGTKLGTVSLIYNGNIIDKFDVVLNNSLHFSIWNFIKDNILIIIFIIIILLISINMISKKKNHKKQRIA